MPLLDTGKHKYWIYCAQEDAKEMKNMSMGFYDGGAVQKPGLRKGFLPGGRGNRLP